MFRYPSENLGATRNRRDFNYLEWTDTDIDPVTRREIFQAAGMGSIWNVQMHEIQHLGATGLYNINGNGSAYGKFIADGSDDYNAYHLDNPNITAADGTVATLGETQIVGFDLSVNDSLVMPIRKEYEAYDDPTLLRVQKAGLKIKSPYNNTCRKFRYMLETPKVLSTAIVKMKEMLQWAISRKPLEGSSTTTCETPLMVMI